MGFLDGKKKRKDPYGVPLNRPITYTNPPSYIPSKKTYVNVITSQGTCKIADLLQKNRSYEEISNFIYPEQINLDFVFNDDTLFMVACSYFRMDIVKKLLETGRAKPEYVNKNGLSALTCVMRGTPVNNNKNLTQTREEFAFYLMDRVPFNLEQLNGIGDSLLMVACQENLPRVFSRILQSGHGILHHVNKKGETVFNIACKKIVPGVNYNYNAMHQRMQIINTEDLTFLKELIKIPQCDVGHVDGNGNTALTILCSLGSYCLHCYRDCRNDNQMCAQCINIGNSACIHNICKQCHKSSGECFCINFDIREGGLIGLVAYDNYPVRLDGYNNYGAHNGPNLDNDWHPWTSMLDGELGEIIFMLLETGRSNPEKVNKNGNTALMMACYNQNEASALKIIETGKSDPGHINRGGKTALYLACEKKLENVALKLIESGQAKPEHCVGRSSVFCYAVENNLKKIVRMLANIGEVCTHPEHTGVPNLPQHLGTLTGSHQKVEEYLREQNLPLDQQTNLTAIERETALMM